MTLAPGTRLQHYEINAKLGAGGMGEVYLAEDTRLERKVALKVLPAEFTQDAERVRRFMQEAKAASALNHPNIITVYDIGECDAGRFIVMEPVAGRTLRTVIAEDNSVETLLSLGQQIAKALSAAHAAGITHRDIKPDNIMVRDDGYVKVLDFGLARLRPATATDSEAATLAQQTTPGTVIGTVAYMSPEQARGEIVNHPSDVFAFFPSTPTRHTVGRERERNELRAAFNAAKDGRGALLCVAGEPGIGKTTLVEDFLTELTTRHAGTIARGRCSERLAGTEAYLPLLEALESLLHARSSAFRRNESENQAIPTEGGTTNSIAAMMKQLAPTWYAQVVPLSGESDESARLLNEVKTASQERMKRELASFLTAVAESQPLVIFFDDLHWADVSTIDLLSFLAGKFDAMRVLIVTTYRPSDMLLGKHPFLQIKPDLQAHGLCRELQLGFLNEAEIAQYLNLEFPRHAFPPDFAKLIHAKTEGSPLFMADLVRYLRDRNVIAQTSSVWKLEQTLPDIERELPESVRGMIERKLAQLSEDDRKLLTAASVQGYEFDSAIVAEVLKLEADEVEERLEKLERVFAFVKLTSESEFPNRLLTLRYRFVHVLYQNALYGALRATRKATLSREVAQILEEFQGEKKAAIASELASLFETGREFAKAADYFLVAAEQANQLFAAQEAATLARRGIDALTSLPESPERAQKELGLQLSLGLALRTIKGFGAEETSKAYARARELCHQIGAAPQLFPVLFGLWESYQNQAQFETGMELAKQMMRAAGEDPALLVIAHNVMGDNLTWLGDFPDAREHLEKGIALYDFEQHRANALLYGYDSGIGCLCFGAIVLWHLGYPDQARAMSDRACDLASQLAHPASTAYATSFAAWFHRLNGALQIAQEYAERTITDSVKYDMAIFLAFGEIALGWAYIGQRKIEEGVTLVREGGERWRNCGALLGTVWNWGILAEGYGKAGRTAESLTLLTEALELATKSGERFYEAELLRLKGELLIQSAAQQLPTEAEGCFQQAIEIARRQSAKSLELRATMSLARLWQQQGKATEARQMLAEIYGWFTEGFGTADLKEARALLAELQHQTMGVSTGSVSDLPLNEMG
jgi:serine/threonine protein kinase/predicted ATPase